MKKPLVSVVVPSYNHAPFLSAAIRSIAAQTHRPLELVVVDDGSTDGSSAIIRRLLEDIDVVSTLLEQPNRGAHEAIMRGVAASSGDVVAILNSDDFYHPNRLVRLVPHISRECEMVFSGVRFVDSQGEELPRSSAWPSWYRESLDQTEFFPSTGFALMARNFSVSSGNFLFTRRLYEKLGGFRELRFAHDWDFLIRSIHYCEPVFIREPLLNYRIHETNTTETVRDLLETESVDALRHYMDLVTHEPSPNPLAPCPANWPRFEHFARRCRLGFDEEATLLDIWESTCEAH